MKVSGSVNLNIFFKRYLRFMMYIEKIVFKILHLFLITISKSPSANKLIKYAKQFPLQLRKCILSIVEIKLIRIKLKQVSPIQFRFPLSINRLGLALENLVKI